MVASLRPILLLTAAAGCALIAAAVAAQDGATVVHEFATFLADDGPTNPDLPALESPGLAAEVDDPEAPARVGVDGPTGDESGYEPAARNGPFDPRDPAALDDATGPEGRLRYLEVFDPSVAPWKRGLVRDRVIDVDGEPVLIVSAAASRPVAVGGSPEPDSVRFDADLEVILRSDVPISIPSVSPEMAILSVQTEPPIAVRFERDDADNFFVVASYDGVVRLRFDAAASATYFEGPPPGARPARAAAPFPDSLRPIADLVMQRIGIVPGTDPAIALTALRDWYGAFDAAELPDAARSRSLWLDLTSMQLGVCRHRAMAFVAAANALGFEARYVHNEAHAFVEVRGEAGPWWRIDLGGAADGLDVLGRDGRPMPASQQGPASPYPQQASNSGASPGGSDAGQRDEADEAVDGSGGSRSGARTNTATTLASLSSPQPSVTGQATRVRSRIELALATSVTFVGEPLGVSGRIVAPGSASIGPQAITLWVGPADSTLRAAPLIPIGVIESDQRGVFEASVVIPSQLRVGDWGVYASWSGSDTLLPAVSE